MHLRELSGRGIRVAVIDTGVDRSHPDVRHVGSGVCVSVATNGETVLSPQFRDGYGHGTACAAIIHRVAPACEIVAVKVTDGENPIQTAHLARGIEWAVHQSVNVISISAGTVSSSHARDLMSCCEEAARRGCVIVASERDDGETTYPAAFPHVIRVGGEADERDVYSYRFDDTDPRRFVAYGGFQRVAWLDPPYAFLSGTSFATARIAGVVALLCERYGRVPHSRMLSLLRNNAVARRCSTVAPVSDLQASVPSPAGSVEGIKRAALFPFSKEMHSLVQFRHLLPFKVVGVSDFIGRRLIGKDCGSALGLPETGLTIQAKLEDALAPADTLILGFTSSLDRLRRRDVGLDIVARAIAMGKNVYSFERRHGPDYDALFEHAARAHRLTWPTVDHETLHALRAQIDSRVPYETTPIVGVFGTSPSQGKFTLQLLLREQLDMQGYVVAQVGTEHQAALFGMDDCFPAGHAKNVSLDPLQWREYFDLRYQQIVRDRRPDIIIAGSQGGLVPYSLYQEPKRQLTAYGVLFLMAIRADSYILVVNHLDTVEMIRDSIDALRVLGRGETILLAVSTKRKRVTESFGRSLVTTEPVEPAEQEAYVASLELRFGIPAVSIMGHGGPERMLQCVLDRYAPRL